MSKRETRDHLGEVRAATVDGQAGVVLQCIKPGVVDDYGSVWDAHCFDESLQTRMPVLCWAHSWVEPLGPAKSFELSDDGPSVSFVFSDFDAVPTAKRAHAQVKDGTITDCSVGFSVPLGGRREPTPEELKQWPGCEEVITKAELDEVSLVLRGAVPGAKVLSVRSAAGTVDMDAVVEIAKRKASGDLTEQEAQAALDLLAVKTDDPPEPEPTGSADGGDPDDDGDGDLGDTAEEFVPR